MFNKSYNLIHSPYHPPLQTEAVRTPREQDLDPPIMEGQSSRESQKPEPIPTIIDWSLTSAPASPTVIYGTYGTGMQTVIYGANF